MDIDKQVIIIQAELLSQDLISQSENRMRLTDKGYKIAEQIWSNIPDQHKFLLIPYLRKMLNLMFKEEEK